MSVRANILMDIIDISISTSILFLLRIGIGIGSDDTFEASIGIEYRQYFWKVSLTTLRVGANKTKEERIVQREKFWV